MVQVVWIKLILNLLKKNRVVRAVCVVVAPLVDLINDHVSSLQRKCITANLTSSDQAERRSYFGHCKLLLSIYRNFSVIVNNIV